MKKLLLILLYLPMIGFGQETYVPDDFFENYLENNNLGNGIEDDNYVSTYLISDVEELDIYVNDNFSEGITDLTGIEYFTSLKNLYLLYHSLTYVDLSNNNQLEYVNISYNGLDSIKLNEQYNLKGLWLHYNNLENINLSSCVNLNFLSLSYNNLTNINLENNNLITDLRLDFNEISELDLSNLNLNVLSIIKTNINNLEINNHNFYSATGSSGDLWLNLDANKFDTLIISNNENLEVLDMYDYADDWYDESESYIKNLIVYENPILNEIRVRNSAIENIYIHSNPLLKDLDLENNLLECLDISNCLNLEVLDCSSNLLNELNTKNGNWDNMEVNALSNNLTCVEVENIGFATNNWLFDSFTSLSINCNYTDECNSLTTSITNPNKANKKLRKITNVLGQETPIRKNSPMFYIYDDGTVEKKVITE